MPATLGQKKSNWPPQFDLFSIFDNSFASNDPSLKLIACSLEMEETDFCTCVTHIINIVGLTPGGRSWIYLINLIREEKRPKMTELNSPAALSCRVTQTITPDNHSLVCHHAP